MVRLSAGLVILIAGLLSLAGASYAAVSDDAAASDPSLRRNAACDPETHVCERWTYAGKPSYVFTGRTSQASRIFRLGADRDVAYVGINTRGRLPDAGNVGLYGDTGNFLLACSAVSGTCELVKASDSTAVMHVLGAGGPNLLAEVETYRTDDLNLHDVSYARSSDRGRTWSPVPLPENCNSGQSCRMALVQDGDYVLLVTDTSARSFDEWTTKVYRSSDRGQTWVQQTKGRGVLSTQWSAYVSRNGVDMTLGPRDHQTAIVNVAVGREDVVLGDMSSLHGSVTRLTGDGDALYALVDSGTFPAKEYRLYLIQNHIATELWRAPTLVGDLWASGQTIVLQTEGTRKIVLPAGGFRSVLYISTDRGKTWQSDALPDELADSVVDVVGDRIWVVTPRAVWYRDIL